MSASAARVIAAALLALPWAVRAADAGDPVRASRRSGPLAVDGVLDEPAWASAPAFDGFVQRFPIEDAAPSEETTVRVLFDDARLYVGVRCQDRRPELLQRALGRRDAAPFGDAITVMVDSARDGRNGFVFTVSAAGVLSDGLQSEDDEYLGDWDAVWEGAASVDAAGWSAELGIPLSALRFQDREDPVLGFAVKRVVGRTHEEDLSIRVPRNARGMVARLAPLTGLGGISPPTAIELVPYAAARLAWTPQYDDLRRPDPRLFQPSADLGLDLKMPVGRGLSLQATLNPDFGQVEADQLVQNLTTFEAFFPEKRAFFTQGMDLFRPVSPQGRASPQQPFYSRRIGLEGPILAAAKLSGAVTDHLQLGLVEAFVAGDGRGDDEEHPARRYRFSAARPLWFGPRSALPARAPASKNFLAGVARWQPAPGVSLGATVTSAVLGGPRCTAAESRITDSDARPDRCDTLAGNAAALDAALRTDDGQWFLRGQVAGSQALGGSPERTLPDGTRIRRGAVGMGAHAAVGRAGGEPWRPELHWEWEAPRLDLNAVGFQPTQNEQLVRAILRYVRPQGGGPFHSYGTSLTSTAWFTADGRGLLRGAQLYAATEYQLRTFDWFGLDAWLDLDQWDVREIDQSAVGEGRSAAPMAVHLPGTAGVDFWASTASSRPIAFDLGGGMGRSSARGPLRGVLSWFAWVNTTVRPHPRMETRLELNYRHDAWPARLSVDSGDDAGYPGPLERQYLFAELLAPTLSVTVRQQLVLTPRLTLQAYGQLFSSTGRYGRFRLATAHGGRIGYDDLGEEVAAPGSDVRTAGWWENPDFRNVSVNLNLVLRWEYRLGSTLYLVYSRAQRELGYQDGAQDPSPPRTLRPVALGIGPASDTILVKWSYWWSR